MQSLPSHSFVSDVQYRSQPRRISRKRHRSLSRTYSVRGLLSNKEDSWSKKEKSLSHVPIQRSENSVIWRHTQFTHDSKIVKDLVVSDGPIAWKHFSFSKDNIAELQYYLDIDKEELCKIESDLASIDNELEEQRIKARFEDLNLDMLERKIFESRMSDIIDGNEIRVRRSITLNRSRSLPRKAIRRRAETTHDELSLKKKSFWELDNLKDLKLVKVLSRKELHVVWMAEIGEHNLVAKQYYNCNPAIRRELKNKIRLMRELEHPHIQKYYGLGRHLGTKEFYVFKELIDGGSLVDFVENGAMNEIAAAHVIFQILTAIKFLHDNGIVHGNIQPRKVLLSRDGIVKLSEFGRKPDNLAIIPHYSAPEVVSAYEFSKRCDIWSVGCVLNELITSKAPFASQCPFVTVQQLSAREATPEIPPTVSSTCASFLSLCWKLEASQRPSANDLLAHNFLKLSPAGHSSLLGFIRRKLYKKETSHNYLQAVRSSK